MRKIMIGAAALMMLAAGPAQARDNVNGLWLTENGRAVVELAPCGNSLCGALHWLHPEARQYDYKNSNAELRTTPLCGLKILWGFQPDGPVAWKDGTIYKADDGDIYNAQLSLRDDGKLHLRGYVGVPMFGKTQTWTRVDAADYKKCDGPTGPYDPALAAPVRRKPAGNLND